ncbi:MAG: hypothetical protein QOJ53_136 [Sphingomonadales bacterium]|nr:hypothetical protein [Sphingomonadales bacterium]
MPRNDLNRPLSLAATLDALYRSLSRRRRTHLLLLLPLMLLSAVAELVTIGAVLPFLAILANPGQATEFPGLGLFRSLFGGADGGNPIVPATILLVAAASASAAIRLLTLRTIQNFAFAVGHEFATTIFGRMLRQPYALYVRRNPSEFVAALEKIRMFVNVLLPAMNGAIAAMVALSIAALLLAIVPLAAALAIAVAILLYVGLSLATHNRLRANSRRIAKLATDRAKAFQEGIGGLRDILLDGSQPVFEDEFRRLDHAFGKVLSSNNFLAAAPRYAVEGAGIALIGLLALYLSEGAGGMLAALPILGAMALGAQRLLPLLQAAWVGWSQLSGNAQILRDLHALMETPVVAAGRPAAPALPFARDIVFDRVSYQYHGRNHAVWDISFAIPKGALIGLVGRTGSGKSSLVDMFLGLLDPTQGEIRIDGRRLDAANRAGWQAQIAHVPQSIYLADASIAANIAFGQAEAKIDMERVRTAARLAQADGFIADLPEGYDTRAGERGIRLSGGQRQRIAIARALDKDASILVLDEATGQLDLETEEAVIDAITAIGREMTILIVTHRDPVLARCDRIMRLDDGRLVDGDRLTQATSLP